MKIFGKLFLAAELLVLAVLLTAWLAPDILLAESDKLPPVELEAGNEKPEIDFTAGKYSFFEDNPNSCWTVHFSLGAEISEENLCIVDGEKRYALKRLTARCGGGQDCDSLILEEVEECPCKKGKRPWL